MIHPSALLAIDDYLNIDVQRHVCDKWLGHKDLQWYTLTIAYVIVRIANTEMISTHDGMIVRATIITNTQAFTGASHVHPWFHCAKIMSAPPASWLVHCATQPQPGHLCKDLAVFSMAGKRHSWNKKSRYLFCSALNFQLFTFNQLWPENLGKSQTKQHCTSQPWLHLSKSAPLAPPEGRPGGVAIFFLRSQNVGAMPWIEDSNQKSTTNCRCPLLCIAYGCLRIRTL